MPSVNAPSGIWLLANTNTRKKAEVSVQRSEKWFTSVGLKLNSLLNHSVKFSACDASGSILNTGDVRNRLNPCFQGAHVRMAYVRIGPLYNHLSTKMLRESTIKWVLEANNLKSNLKLRLGGWGWSWVFKRYIEKGIKALYLNAADPGSVPLLLEVISEHKTRSSTAQGMNHLGMDQTSKNSHCDVLLQTKIIVCCHSSQPPGGFQKGIELWVETIVMGTSKSFWCSCVAFVFLRVYQAICTSIGRAFVSVVRSETIRRRTA